ncbi:MAG: CehA/McbA family metallohydrolase [Deltaproteobacteria bacterium]|nr:CehA/McbA family metallohydrolase [Deltaproteobacteria bacterium]
MNSMTTRASLLGLAAITVCASACSCGDAPVPVVAGHLDLDTVLGDGEVRCGPITKQSELIGGPQAYAQIGRSFRCHNSRIRFVIQDATRPIGNSTEGGDLIDIDRVRPDELADGEDTFREFLPALGANEVRVESITVVNDGTNGQPGVIRVSGRPTTITLAPQAAFLSQDIVGTVFTDYLLKPDSDVIEITTTLINEGELLQAGLGADFLAFGGATPPFSPERGFGEVPLFTKISFLAGARGKGVNTAYVCDQRDVLIPLVESGATVAICDDNLFIGSEGGFTRSIIVGDGSLDSVARPAWALRGIATGEVSGSVDGAVVGTIVSALTAPLPLDGSDEGSRVMNEARVAADGSYTMALPPGDYTLVAHVPDITGTNVARSNQVAVALIESGAVVDDVTAGLLTLGRSGHIVVTTTFDDDVTRPAKLTLIPIGDTQKGSATLLEFEADGAARYAVTNNGTFDVEVPPGRWRVLVTRGFEFSRHDEEVDVVAGGSVFVAATLARAIESVGWLAGEFHQHSLSSLDAVVPLPLKVMENAAEGIEIAVSTEHDNIVDFRPFVEALGLSQHVVAFAGNEVSYQAIGHFNAYPFLIDDADPFRDIGTRLWWLKTLPEMYADIRSAAGTNAIVQINHPRSGGTGALASMKFDPSDGKRIPRDSPELPTLPPTIYSAWSPQFDALEVNTNLGSPEQFTADGAVLAGLAANDATAVPVLADWFGLMGAGLNVAAMGNSDTHSIDEGVGYPRTFLFAGNDDATTLSEIQLQDLIRAQRTAIAEGCLLTLEIAGVPRMGRGDLLTRAEGDLLVARLQAPPHVTVGRLELYVNGVAQKLTAVSNGGTPSPDDAIVVDDAAGVLSLPLAPVVAAGSERLAHTLTDLPLAEDAVVVVVSRGGSGLDPTGGGQVICISPPAYVDVDGDGGFTPWLAATEQVTQATE